MGDVRRSDLESVLNALGAAVWRADLPTGLVEGSPGCVSLFGVPAEELTLEGLRALRPWPSGRWRKHESAHRLPDGGWVLSRMVAVSDPEGNVVGVIGLETPELPDTLPPRADTDAYADAQLLSDVLALQPTLISRWSADGTVIWCNDAYASSFGLTVAEMIGRNWVDCLEQIGHGTREDLERLRVELLAVTERGLSTVVAPLRRDGPVRWFQWTHRRLPTTAGSEVIVQDVGQEVTELRTARDALDAMAHELALGREAERRSLARRLHDDVVQALVSASWAISPGDGQASIAAADAERAAEILRAAIEHLRSCLTDLTSPLQLAGSLTDAIAADCDAVRAAGIVLTTRIDEVPNEEIRAIAARVVNEALRNVVRHAHADNVTISIDVESGLVVGAIADNGVGTTDDDVTRALASGHVGLLTSRSLVEAVGGEFAVRRISTSGGVMVRFSMPLPSRADRHSPRV